MRAKVPEQKKSSLPHAYSVALFLVIISVLGYVGFSFASAQNKFKEPTAAPPLGQPEITAGGWNNTGSGDLYTTTNVGINVTNPSSALDIFGAITLQGMQAPSLPGKSSLGNGRIYFDKAEGKFKVSQNGGDYVDLLGGAVGTPLNQARKSVPSTPPLTEGAFVTPTGSDITFDVKAGRRVWLSYTGEVWNANGCSTRLVFTVDDIPVSEPGAQGWPQTIPGTQLTTISYLTEPFLSDGSHTFAVQALYKNESGSCTTASTLNFNRPGAFQAMEYPATSNTGGGGLGGTVAWNQINSFPPSCGPGEFVTGVGSSLSCAPGGAGSSQWNNKAPNIYFNTGNVGIGTQDPSTKLEVVGTVKATEFQGKFVGDGSGLTGITLSGIADDSINGSKLINGTVSASKMSSGSCAGGQLVRGFTGSGLDCVNDQTSGGSSSGAAMDWSSSSIGSVTYQKTSSGLGGSKMFYSEDSGGNGELAINSTGTGGYELFVNGTARVKEFLDVGGVITTQGAVNAIGPISTQGSLTIGTSGSKIQVSSSGNSLLITPNGSQSQVWIDKKLVTDNLVVSKGGGGAGGASIEGDLTVNGSICVGGTCKSSIPQVWNPIYHCPRPTASDLCYNFECNSNVSMYTGCWYIVRNPTFANQCDTWKTQTCTLIGYTVW